MQISVEALKQMVGEQVMCQMKGGWIAVHAERGKPEPLGQLTKNGEKQLVVTPFVCGMLVDHDGALFLKYSDPTSGKYIEVLLRTEEIVSVARVIDERIVRPC